MMSSKTRQLLKDVGVPLGAAVLGALATILVSLSGSFDKNREMDIKMLEVALAILREDPAKSQIAGARGWAVDLINHVSPVRIPPDARQQLIKNKLLLFERFEELRKITDERDRKQEEVTKKLKEQLPKELK